MAILDSRILCVEFNIIPFDGGFNPMPVELQRFLRAFDQPITFPKKGELVLRCTGAENVGGRAGDKDHFTFQELSLTFPVQLKKRTFKTSVFYGHKESDKIFNGKDEFLCLKEGIGYIAYLVPEGVFFPYPVEPPQKTNTQNNNVENLPVIHPAFFGD